MASLNLEFFLVSFILSKLRFLIFDLFDFGENILEKKIVFLFLDSSTLSSDLFEETSFVP